MIEDSDNGAIEAIISKLSIIYNNSQRAHTKIPRAQDEIIVCLSGMPFNLRKSVVSIMENTKLNLIKSIASKKREYGKFSGSRKQQLLKLKYSKG